jgi:hypothetical protein
MDLVAVEIAEAVLAVKPGLVEADIGLVGPSLSRFVRCIRQMG